MKNVVEYFPLRVLLWLVHKLKQHPLGAPCDDSYRPFLPLVCCFLLNKRHIHTKYLDGDQDKEDFVHMQKQLKGKIK